MRKQSALKTRLAWVLASVLITPLAKADSVLELFTSHGCYSCPPAEKLLTELTEEEEGLIALEFHVDYWNSLIYGSAGSWVDPFSKPAYSNRQRYYNTRDLQGREGVYTPQAVINGKYAAVGSNRSQVKAAIAQSLGDNVSVDIDSNGDEYLVRVNNHNNDPSVSDSRVWLVRFIKSITTEITSGENKGKTLTNHNVVISMESLGRAPQTDSAEFKVSVDDDPNMGCAIVVQDEFQSPILAASECTG